MTDLADFAVDLRSEGYSPTTIQTYSGVLRRPLPFDLPGTAREVKTYLAQRRDEVSVNSTVVELRALRCFSRWHAAEYGSDDELAALRFPTQTRPTAGRIARDEDVSRLLGQLQRSPAEMIANARDVAIVELLVATGARRSEIVRIRTEDVDYEAGLIRITDTKSKRERFVPLPDDVARSLKRWERQRAKHEFADEPELFLGERGPLTPNGLGQRLETLSKRYGIVPKLMPHQFRRALAHRWVERGGADDSLQQIGGWADSKMVSHYRREFVASRALEDYKRLMVDTRPTMKIARPGRRKG